MNKRTIFLDFTALLDVIMIILFFFILFSHLETEEERARLEEAQQSAEMREEEASQRYEELENLLADAKEKDKQAEEKLKEAEAASERSGENVEAITEFSRNQNVRIDLKMINGMEDWCLEIHKGEELLSKIQKAGAADMAAELQKTLAAAGYQKEDTLLCMFLYNGEENGTNSAWLVVEEVFEKVKAQYQHFFFSEIDTSL